MIGPCAQRVRRAFTLIEMLVVVTLLIVVLGVAVPAFRGMIDASERSLSENALRVGVRVARDLALRGEGDAAIVFFRDLDGRMRMVPALQVGTLADSGLNPFATFPFNPETDPVVERDVFAPVGASAQIQMPKGWTVAGYADPNTIDIRISSLFTEGWYNSEAYGDAGQARGETARLDGNWLLPETAYYETFMLAPGAPPPSGFTSTVSGADISRTPRQTFMVRFQSGTGQLVRGAAPALVIDPRPTAIGRGLFTPDVRWMRANRIEDARAWAQRVLRQDDVNSDGVADFIDETFRVITIGNYSNDTVLAGPVSRLALFRAEDLAQGLGAKGLNRATNSLYAPIERSGRIGFDLTGLFENHPFIDEPNEVRIGINRWIQGDTNFVAAGGFENSDTDGDGNVYGDAGDGVEADTPKAKIFIVEHGTGELTGVAR